MKVLIVIGTLDRGGSERQIVEFVRAAHPYHATCLVVCQGSEGALAGEIREAGARLIALNARRAFSPRALWRLARILKTEQPGVVYGFLFWGYTITMPLARLLAPRSCRIQGRRSFPDSDVPRRRFFRPLRRVADRCSDGAIANSIPVARAVARAERGFANRIWVVPNGVRPRAARRMAGASPLIIACIANLIWYKGHATLLAAVRRLRPGEWQVVLAGDGPERSQIEQMIRQQGLDQKVTVLGTVQDVDQLLERAGIAVLPSYTESMPNACLEAMAHGLPLVSSAVGGVELLLGSGAGVAVPPRDDVALAAAMQSLIDDPLRREQMGAKGRKIIADNLAIENMRDSTLRAFRQICRAEL